VVTDPDERPTRRRYRRGLETRANRSPRNERAVVRFLNEIGKC